MESSVRQAAIARALQKCRSRFTRDTIPYPCLCVAPKVHPDWRAAGHLLRPTTRLPPVPYHNADGK